MTIVEELRENRESGAKRLEKEYKASLMTVAMRFCADQGDAEELVNSTFSVVVERIKDYREQSAFFAWMCQILFHLHSEGVRRKSNQTIVYPGDVPDVLDSGAEERIFADIDAAIVRDVVEKLPEELREAIILHYFSGLSVLQIARFSCIPVGTVKSRLHYARKALAAKLGVAAKKPGVKAVLLALALAALTAVGAVGVVAIRAALSEQGEEIPEAPVAAETNAAPRNAGLEILTAENKEHAMNTNAGSSILAAASLAAALSNAAVLSAQGQSIPSEYIAVQYIESAGSQYIDTGVRADSSLRVVADFEFAGTPDKDAMGAICKSGDVFIRHHMYATSSQFVYHLGTVNATYSYSSGRHEFDADPAGGSIRFDDSTTALSPGSFDTGLNYWLFGRNANQAAQMTFSAMKLYSCKMYRGGELVRDFVPVVHIASARAGLLDIADGHNVFYPNAASSGPDFSFESDFDIAFSSPARFLPYTGAAIEPEVVVTSVATGDVLPLSDFDVAYLDNVDIGTAYAVVTGTGEYKGVRIASFRIGGSMAHLATIGRAVEYISGDGTAYINLGMKFDNLCSVRAVVMQTEDESCAVFGSRTSGSSADNYLFGVNTLNTKDSWSFDFLNTSSGRLSLAPKALGIIGKKVEVRMGASLRGVYDPGTGSQIGDISTTSISTAFTTPYNAHLFGGSGTIWSNSKFKGRVYSFRIEKGGETLMNLVPFVHGADSQAGMYDLVTGGVFFNAESTGAFSAPPADFTVEVEDAWTSGESVEPAVVVRNGSGAIVPVSGYTVAYFGNTSPGTGGVIVTGVDGISGSVGATFSIYRLRRVAPDAPAGRSGASWGTACTLDEAFSGMERHDKILLKAGTYTITSQKQIGLPLYVCGGYAGTDGDALAANPMSVLDAENNQGFATIVVVQNSDSATSNVFSRIAFARGSLRGMFKTGAAAALYLDHCAFLTNGTAQTSSDRYPGNGLYVYSGSHVEVSDSRFVGNRANVGKTPASNGAGVAIRTCNSSVFRRCTFVANGAEPFLSCSRPADENNSIAGQALYSSVPVTVEGCRFVANAGAANTSGGTVFLSAGANGSVFRNCLFAGNENICPNASANTSRGGTLVVSDSSVTARIDRCTFAYNLSDTADGAAALTVAGGCAEIADSIFFGNILASRSTTRAADVCVWENAAANVKYSLFTANSAESVFARGTMNFGTGVIFGNPQFVTRSEDVASHVANAAEGYVCFTPGEAHETFLRSINCHVSGLYGYVDENTGMIAGVGRRSPAIDAGDPGSDFSLEPNGPGGWNGGRINLGFYGNTPWATMTTPQGGVLYLR